MSVNFYELADFAGSLTKLFVSPDDVTNSHCVNLPTPLWAGSWWVQPDIFILFYFILFFSTLILQVLRTRSAHTGTLRPVRSMETLSTTVHTSALKGDHTAPHVDRVLYYINFILTSTHDWEVLELMFSPALVALV